MWIVVAGRPLEGGRVQSSELRLEVVDMYERGKRYLTR